MSKSAFSVTGIGGGGGLATSTPAVIRSVSQNAHGLSLGQVVRLNGAALIPAKADTVVNAETIGLVTEVTDANTVKVQLSGYINQGLVGLAAGTVYFLSATVAGTLTDIPPTGAQQVIKPMLVADSATSGYLLSYRGNITTANVGAVVVQQAAAKAWARVKWDGAAYSLGESFNILSLTVNGTGDVTVNYTVPMASSNYAYVIMTDRGNPVVPGVLNVGYLVGAAGTNGVTAGSIRCIIGGDGTGPAFENQSFSMLCFGA